MTSEIYLKKLGDMLKQQEITGEILLVEKGMLLLDIHQREVSKDINVSFGPGEALREAASLLAVQEGLPPHWLEQAIEDNLPGRTPSDGVTYPGLHIFVAPRGYFLTMSLLFGKPVDDEVIHEQARALGISTVAEIFSLVKKYLPEQNIPSNIQEKIEQKFVA